MLAKVLCALPVLLISLVLRAQQPLTNLYFFHHQGCPGCAKVKEHVLPPDSAGNYIESHFNLLQIDVAEDESGPLLDKYKISQTPTFLFMDDNNEVLVKIATSKFTAKSFIRRCEDVLQLKTLKKQYVAGTAKPDQVRELLTLYEVLSGAGDTTYFPIARNYLAAQPEKKLNTYENRALIYTLTAKHPLIVTFNSTPYKVLLTKKADFYKSYDTAQVDARICWVATLTNDVAIAHADTVLFNASLKVLANYQNKKSMEVKDGYGKVFSNFTLPSLHSRQLSYWASNDTLRFNNWETQQAKQYWNDAAQLTYLTYVYLALFPSDIDAAAHSKLLKAETFTERAIVLNDNYDNNLARATVLSKLNMKNEAIAALERTLSIGKATKVDVTKATTLLAELQKPVK